MKRLLALLFSLVLLLGLAVPAYAAKAKAVVLRLQVAEGSVYVRDAAGVPVNYTKDMRLYSGYSVSTDDKSSAYILLDEDKAVKLDRNTTVAIKKSGKKLQVKLKAGQLFFNVTAPLNSGEALEIRTSSMIVGVRGSSGIVSLREVIFITGHGVVTCGGRQYAIAGGESFRPSSGVHPAGVPTLPALCLKEIRDDALLQSRIREEGVYDPEILIAAIPAAELREEEAWDEAEEAMIPLPAADSVEPAFQQGSVEPASYTITWKDDEGNVIDTTSVAAGETPSHEAPVKEATDKASYAFVGWDRQPAPATEDTTYTAVFEATYDFTAIIPPGTGNMPYQIYYNTSGNTPVTTAKEGEEFTFYLTSPNSDVMAYSIRLNGELLGEESVYFSKESDALVCTFTVPKDPTIEIVPG